MEDRFKIIFLIHGAYKDGREIWVARPFAFFVLFLSGSTNQSPPKFSGPSTFAKNVFWPVLISAPCNFPKIVEFEGRFKNYSCSIISKKIWFHISTSLREKRCKSLIRPKKKNGVYVKKECGANLNLSSFPSRPTSRTFSSRSSKKSFSKSSWTVARFFGSESMQPVKTCFFCQVGEFFFVVQSENKYIYFIFKYTRYKLETRTVYQILLYIFRSLIGCSVLSHFLVFFSDSCSRTKGA